MIDNLIKAATCRISCGNDSGTGHLVTDFHVLTARHCVIKAIESGSAIELSFSGPRDDVCIPATIVAQSEEMDVCILSISTQLNRKPIPLNAETPREGGSWRTFGYPSGKTQIGHRVVGTISQVLDAPKLKMDIDLTVEPSTALQSFQGISGAVVVCDEASQGVIRLKLDGTLGAISIQRLAAFLAKNGIQIVQPSAEEEQPSEPLSSLADRSIFQERFEQVISGNQGNYIFLEGAHGIGKTTFCREFEADDNSLFNLGTYTLTSPQDRGPGAIYRTQPDVFFDWLSTTVSTLITGKASRNEERNYTTIIRETETLLNAFSDYCASNDRHGILFIDGLNEAQTADSSAFVKLVGLLPQSLPASISVILTAPNYQSIALYLMGRVKSQNVISLPPLSDEASTAFCWQELVEHRSNPVLIARICERAKGHPLYLRYLIEYINSSSQEDSLNDFPILTGSIEQYYESLWPKLLQDDDAVLLLAIMARLRWGIRTGDLLKILTSAEQNTFISTIGRIRHLLLRPDSTTIYHSSFAEFLISKTADFELLVQQRIADFCVREEILEYCVLNVIFHLLRAGEASRSQAVVACNQDWVDKCVSLEVDPDILLFDIEETLSAGVCLGPAVEVFRLLLLFQRVSFRYNALFAQSARLISEALIALKRPREALQHAIRFNTLIVAPDEALVIAFRLIQHEYLDEARELLKILHRRILEAYSSASNGFELEEFINLSRLHLQTVLFMRLSGGGGGMHQITSILNHSLRVLKGGLKEAHQEILEECFVRLQCVPTSYFLCFRDTYASLAQLKELAPDIELPPTVLMNLIWALFECEDSLQRYTLPNAIEALSQVFSDMQDLITAGVSIDRELIPAVLDTLILLGSPSYVVCLIAERGEKLLPTPLNIKAGNNVDVNFRDINHGSSIWRAEAFLGDGAECPLVGAFDDDGWLTSLDQLIRALSWCEGKAQRAVSDKNETLRLKSLEILKARVLQPLAFTLAQRVKWQDSYAVPENAFPAIYERIVQLLMNCFPEELPTFIRSVTERASNQCGLYSEGFREVMFSIFQRLTTQDIDESLSEEVFALLEMWKHHAIGGVENRHELVPELLRLIPMFVKIDAPEEAENLYRHMLSVSMGPSWYKEDQLGLMVSTLRKMPSSESTQSALPLVAGYLERASGEMTFQRFIRYEKMALIGDLFRRGNIANGCRYFRRQSCGSVAELLSECQHGIVDKPTPLVGMRHPGGALDEQDAILEMVSNSKGINWYLRWALLEIFQCGDERHLTDYAIEYAKLINQEGAEPSTISEMVSRLAIVVGSEIELSERSRFLDSFLTHLDPLHSPAFSDLVSKFPVEVSRTKIVPPFVVDEDDDAASTAKEDDSQDTEDRLYLPGVFGHRSASKEAEAALDLAEKQLKLRNLDAAKNQAVKVLQLLQDGGWSIWGNLSSTSARAEAILRERAGCAEDVIRAYASLLERERHNEKWKLAEHLIEKTADLLDSDQRDLLLRYVIDHIRLMVGDATKDISTFGFLSEEQTSNASMELFKFILWLLDHPQHLRREKAAGITSWLIEKDRDCFEVAVREAFSMDPGYRADILSGIFNEMSIRRGSEVWDLLLSLVCTEDILQNCKHVGRLAVLHRIAKRAGNRGREFASRIEGLFRSGEIELGASEHQAILPKWARCVLREWAGLDQLGLESVDNQVSQMTAAVKATKDAKRSASLS